MKLITKTILFYLLVSLPLILIAGLFSFYLIRAELRDGTDESLWKEKIGAERMITMISSQKTIYLSADSLSIVEPTNESFKNPCYTDTVLYDSYEDEILNFRILTSYFTSNSQLYKISVAKPTYEEDELMESLLSVFGLIIGFLVIAFFLVNWLLSKALWKPFYKTVESLSQYDIKKHKKFNFEKVNTKEFNQLNNALNIMIEKINLDFLHQKEFTENASHEMQTPLSVIKANLNLLMQSPNLKEEEMSQLQAIENTTKKLASLNKALLLLAKIENHQFKEDNLIDIKAVVEKVLENFEDLLLVKKIDLKLTVSSELKILLNTALAEVLISNLVQNAIRHNHERGKIIIEISNDTLSVSNTGEPLKVNHNDLFARFKKNDASKDSIGLGLAIVKSIVDLYGYAVSHAYEEGMHTFRIKFN